MHTSENHAPGRGNVRGCTLNFGHWTVIEISLLKNAYKIRFLPLHFPILIKEIHILLCFISSPRNNIKNESKTIF